MELTELTIRELSEKLRKKEISSVELTGEYLKRIEKLEPKLHAYVTVTKDEALKTAAEADKALASGAAGPLTGVPISVKDIFCTKGIRTTCSSRILENFVPPFDATVVRKLKEAGAIILGKNNMDEFAMGSSTENSAFYPTLNPWDLSRVPGGSSGGSAASVAASECAASVGTDTGGSIRQPAACCGVVGLKPTYGRVSRFGMIAFASSLDQAGPLTKDVADAALMLGAIAGHDPLDSTSINAPVGDYSSALTKDGLKGVRVGIPDEYFIDGIDPEVGAAVNAAIDVMKKLGATTVKVSLPHTSYAVAVYYLVATAEASSNLARYDGVKYGRRAEEAANLLDMYKTTRDAGFGAEVKRRIMLGTYALSAGYYDAYYKKANDVRALITRDFDEAFKSCDVIATPTAPTAAFKLNEKVADPLTMYLSDIFTISCNLAGLPGISLPCGFTKAGLPIGLQILGKRLDEGSVLKAAYAYESAAGWSGRRAKL